ncbi:cellulose synthase-like protein E1 [Vigna unguiculata]|uniref:cellulose synthase-like protein E1 n=1 Tax=Vigna unguiculata TaxID=3917 RepID=UPI0010164542|nr:cellulose synthase-like protein E1 [Vigna unguiculata]
MGSGEQHSLFETRKDRARHIRRLYAVSLFVAICFVWAFRLTHIPAKGEAAHWAWLGLFLAELWSGIYWVFYQALRWNMIFRTTFPNTLSQRYESRLPGVDIFVFTADAAVEPPLLVINTVLSLMAYDYPPQKLSVYLSDDGGSEITFYALLEASSFAKHWVPFCKIFKVEPRSPAAFFNNPASTKSEDHNYVKHLATIHKLYEEMKRRVEDATKLGVPSEARSKHNGFSQWDSYSSSRDHDTILQILLHKNDWHGSKDVDGCILPTLVYMAREKRPQYHTHYKAGAINSLLRISSTISRGKIILFLDCDMYSTNSQSVRDVLCFFMDERKGQRIGYVQLPQYFDNIGKNDLYGNALSETMQIHLHGEDGLGGPLCIGTCCFFRRDALCGKKFNDQEEKNCNDDSEKEVVEVNMQKLEEEAKALASCTYEKNTLWGKKIGQVYGCLVEDVITGFRIHSQGWKSVCYNPQKKCFLGVAPTNLLHTLVQQKRWAQGDLQILLSEFRPTWYGDGKINLSLLLGYEYTMCFSTISLPILYYSIIPSLYLLKGIPLFPKMSSSWLIPFAYVIVGETIYSLVESLSMGGSIRGWWNAVRMWLYLKTSAFFFAFVDGMLGFFGHSNSSFVVTSKTIEDGAAQRYEKEMMEFGTSSPYFTVLATLALLNLFCLLSTLNDLVLAKSAFSGEKMALQVLVCGVLVFINFPIYEAIFLRKDKGRMPASVSVKSIALAFTACVFFKLLK